MAHHAILSEPFRKAVTLDLSSPAEQASYVEDAFLAQDPFLVVLALKEIGTVKRVPIALDENPMLSEVLRAVDALGLEIRIVARS